MIIIKVMGGLGNQLQQYALYEKYKKYRDDVYLDTSWFEDVTQNDKVTSRVLELELFTNANYISATSDQMLELLGAERGIGKYINKFTNKFKISSSRHIFEKRMFYSNYLKWDNVYLEGYWAAEKYYVDILSELREKLSFAGDIPNNNMKMAYDIKRSSYSCSVHIRRADYLNAENAAMFGGICTEQYYEAAFDYVKAIHPDTTFYVFSDDVNFVKSHYGDRDGFIIVDINHYLNSRYDIFLMSHCNAHICANSTFSFWGARLDVNRASSIMIRPYIHANTQKFKGKEMHELWSDWVLIDSTGIIR